ncbi:MAG: hypothetical protein C4530_20960 [Desulfobacteraceae bacterium]|nr:MAG: hypothetical protein C4530_20960 [Desulfobacteraceae bacterium]
MTIPLKIIQSLRAEQSFEIPFKQVRKLYARMVAVSGSHDLAEVLAGEISLWTRVNLRYHVILSYFTWASFKISARDFIR